MRVEVRSHNIDRPRAVCEHATNRLDLATRRFGERVAAAQVHISDLHGPRGGADKRCLIQLQGRALHIVVEGLGPDPYAAIDDAVDRVGRSLRRAMDRGRSLHAAGRRAAADRFVPMVWT